MLYLTCTTIISVDLAQYGISHAKDWISGYCGTNPYILLFFPKSFDLLANRLVITCLCKLGALKIVFYIKYTLLQKSFSGVMAL